MASLNPVQSALSVHAVERLNLIEPHDVAKVPADEDIYPRQCRERDVEHVVAIARTAPTRTS